MSANNEASKEGRESLFSERNGYFRKEFQTEDLDRNTRNRIWTPINVLLGSIDEPSDKSDPRTTDPRTIQATVNFPVFISLWDKFFKKSIEEFDSFFYTSQLAAIEAEAKKLYLKENGSSFLT